jgi:hypothetical protein
MGVLVPPRWCQNHAQQNRQKHRNPRESDRPTHLVFLKQVGHLLLIVLLNTVEMFSKSPCETYFTKEKEMENEENPMPHVSYFFIAFLHIYLHPEIKNTNNTASQLEL